ncbi:uncharacterized protein N7469_002222 [Penicillium citrinum]|uniref:Uncharacterized protein n=1 Tax=Penicillium citrinum TaxID=5077 RepID=A0A9W9P9X2_PENCI|nr:uncharacterized protein N7469_002222 [Penicillium citrinum]KAJ5240631.1 hypothetical protein N7469_002222 [Penicillium citrinum]
MADMFDDLVLEARALNKGMKSQLSGHRRSSPASTSANLSTPTHRRTPQRPIQEKFFISTTYSTITARALSFQGQVLNGVTPLQLAQNGFYYQPHTTGGVLACCFACQNFKRLDSFQRTIYNDLKQHSQTADTLTPSTNTRHHKKTTANFSTQTPTQSTPTAPSTVENDSYTQPSSTTITDPEPQLPPTAHSPQPHQAIPSVTSSPQNQQNTYSSVLQRPVTSIPQPIPPAQKPAFPAKPILTIEDLRRRFHNKPSPFQIENKKSQRSIKRTRNKPISATQSLSKFLASALPAFSRYLKEMQPKSGTCYSTDRYCLPYRETKGYYFKP